MCIHSNYQQQPQQYIQQQPQQYIIVQEQKSPVAGILAAGAGLYIGYHTLGFTALTVAGGAFISDTASFANFAKAFPACSYVLTGVAVGTIITGVAITALCANVARKNL